jgi:ribonuclease HI
LWERLEEWWLKLNIDGESRGNLGLGSVGDLLRDHAWFTKPTYFVSLYHGTNKRVEDMKVIKGIDLVIQHLGI